MSYVHFLEVKEALVGLYWYWSHEMQLLFEHRFTLAGFTLRPMFWRFLVGEPNAGGAQHSVNLEQRALGID
jgi:hypothetical protein